MQTLILTLHIIVCVLLVILILLQAGKEGMGVIFGGGNSSVFGSGGAGGILAKLTTLMAVIFVITSLSYTYVTSSRPSSESTILNVKIEDTAAPAKSAAPFRPPLFRPRKPYRRPRTRAPHPPQSRRPRLWPRRARPPRPVRQPRPRELPANSFSPRGAWGGACVGPAANVCLRPWGKPCGRIFLGGPHSARPVRRVSWPIRKKVSAKIRFVASRSGIFRSVRTRRARRSICGPRTCADGPQARQTLLRLLPQRPLKTRGTRSFFCGP